MNVVDSSGWLEYFSAGSGAAPFKPVIANTTELIVPAIVIYEVFKKIRREQGEQNAVLAVTHMRLGLVAAITEDLAIAAARHALPMADSLIYATAQQHKATLWTQDAHFKDLPGVRYFAKV